MSALTRFCISRPYGEGGRVAYRVRLVIEDVPDDTTAARVLEWLDDYDRTLDSAFPEKEWSAGEQLSAADAPRVRWTGGK